MLLLLALSHLTRQLLLGQKLLIVELSHPLDRIFEQSVLLQDGLYGRIHLLPVRLRGELELSKEGFDLFEESGHVSWFVGVLQREDLDG